MIKGQDMVYLNGKMAGSMKESGRKENNTGLDFLLLKIISLKKESGNMERRLNG